MSDFTPRANLRLPGGGSTGTILPDEQVDIDVLNDNFRKIDALLGARNIPSASSYAGSMDGDLVYARDTEFLHMFSANAGGLITPRLPGSKMFSGTRAERVAFTGARDGDMWRDTNNIGIIWAYKAGLPGTWVYSGNKCRGTKADILQTGTDGIAVPGMVAFCIDDNIDYVRDLSQWREGADVGVVTFTAAFTSTNSGVTAPVYYGVVSIPIPNPRGVAPKAIVETLGSPGSVQWHANVDATATHVTFRALRIGAYPTTGTATIVLIYGL